MPHAYRVTTHARPRPDLTVQGASLARMDDDAYPDDPYRGPEVHEYEPDSSGRCMSGWTNARGEWVRCNSRQRSSVLHIDEEADFRQRHWHGGGDCMCFEQES